MNNQVLDSHLTEPFLNQPLVAPVYETIEPSQPAIARPADARNMDVPGQINRLQLSSAQTGGRLTAMTCEVAPDSGPPPHMHQHEDEIFIVQSGNVEFFLNGEYIVATAGDVIFAARGEAHTFRGLESSEPNRFTVLVAPGRNFEEFYDGWEAMNNQPDISPLDMMAHGEKHGLALFPPDAPVEIPVVEKSRSKVVRGGTTPVLDTPNGRIQIVLSAQDTGGAYGLIHFEGRFNDGPPPHMHQREDEVFLLETGSMQMWLNGETHNTAAGDISWAPRQVPHAFRFTAEEGTTGWGLILPGGFESFFPDTAELMETNAITMENMMALSAKYDLKFLPPA